MRVRGCGFEGCGFEGRESGRSTARETFVAELAVMRMSAVQGLLYQSSPHLEGNWASLRRRRVPTAGRGPTCFSEPNSCSKESTYVTRFTGAVFRGRFAGSTNEFGKPVCFLLDGQRGPNPIRACHLRGIPTRGRPTWQRYTWVEYTDRSYGSESWLSSRVGGRLDKGIESVSS